MQDNAARRVVESRVERLKVQFAAWYQAGASLIDFTDSANPKEIGCYDRGPISTGTNLILSGLWSTYYYNGQLHAIANQLRGERFADLRAALRALAEA